MSLEAIRNAAEMTAHPKLSQLLALLIAHGGPTIGEPAPLLDLAPFMVLRFANRLVCPGYGTRRPGNDERCLARIAGCEIEAVMPGPRP